MKMKLLTKIGIEVTNICNFRCDFCNNNIRSQKSQGIMSNKDFFRVVDEAIDLGVKEVHLIPSSGDVFCDPDIYEKIDYLEKKEDIKKIWFFTNYCFAQPEKLKNLRKTRIYVSIYGESDEEFTSLTNRPTSYRHKVLENLENSKGLDFIRTHARSFTYIDNYQDNVRRIKGLCSAMTNPYVHYNLDVSMCYCGVIIGDSHLLIGNLRESTILELVSSDKVKYYIRKHIDNEHERPCIKCAAFSKADLNLEILKLLGK